MIVVIRGRDGTVEIFDQVTAFKLGTDGKVRFTGIENGKPAAIVRNALASQIYDHGIAIFESGEAPKAS